MLPRNPKWPAVAMPLLLAGVSLLYLSSTVTDADLWGHVRFGQDILRTHSLSSKDPYSYVTEGSAWINHEWLSELLFALTYEAAGPRGLIALKTAFALLLVGGSYVHLRRRGLNSVSTVVLVLLAVLALRPGLGTLRPQIFTYLAFFTLLVLIQHAEEGHPRGLMALPLVFALWANLHGGVLAGLAVLGLWAVVRVSALVRSAPGSGLQQVDVRHLGGFLSLVAATAAAVLVNPYGIRLFTFLFSTATVPRPEIVEWLPLEISSQFGAIYLALVGVTALGIAFADKTRRPGPILILAMMAITPLIAVRHLPLFALTVVVLAGPLLAEASARRERPRLPSHSVSLVSIAAGALCMTLAAPNFRCIHLDPASAFPTRAIAVLKRSGVAGNVATIFNWGEFVIWHVGPRVKVSIDGRRETVYSDALLRKALSFMNGTAEWDAILREAQTDMALVQAGSAAANLLQLHPGWVPVYQDRVSRLFVRRGSMLRETLSAVVEPDLPVDGEGMCFPEPGLEVSLR